MKNTIVLCLFAILFFSSCCNDCVDAIEITDGRYMGGNVVLNATTDDNVGIVKIAGQDNSLKGCIYLYEPSMILNRYEKVYFKIKNYGDYNIAFDLKKSKSGIDTVHWNDVFDIAKKLEMNLHNASGHSTNAWHIQGHIRPKSNTATQEEETIDGTAYIVMENCSVDNNSNCQPAYMDKKTFAYYEKLGKVNGDFFLETKADTIGGVQYIFIVSISTSHQHFGDVPKIPKQ